MPVDLSKKVARPKKLKDTEHTIFVSISFGLLAIMTGSLWVFILTEHGPVGLHNAMPPVGCISLLLLFLNAVLFIAGAYEKR